MRAYYVTLQRDTTNGVKTAWLLGPYATHDEALALVHTARDLAEEADPRTVWDAFGTSSITRDSAASLDQFPPGKLNSALEFERPAA